jgi:histidyl-tRNA synthetase
MLNKLRGAGIACEIYPDQAKLKKQLDYANKKMIPYTLVLGSDEVKSGQLAFKDMNKGEQEKLTIDQIIDKLN